MGIACSKSLEDLEREEAKAQDARNSRILKEHAETERNVVKLLLLGAGESGKSTIFKQIKILFQKGYDDLEKRSFIPVIHANVYQSLITLLNGCKEFAENDDVNPSKYVLLPENQEFGDKLSLMEFPEHFPRLDEKNALKVRSCWRDPAIQEAFHRGNELQLPDCTRFFLDNLLRLAGENYIPSQEDILYARQQTTGILETEFRTPGKPLKRGETCYRVFDVGGQRSERRKWIHLFEGVTAIIFCAALSDYDQTLLEDNSKNRMMETKDLFVWLLQQPWFKNTSFLLFLNKYDLFQEKVLKVPLSVCGWFEDYRPLESDVHEVKNAYMFVKQKFEQIYKENSESENIKRMFKVYQTTAIDERLIKRTFDLVDQSIYIELLQKADYL
ncbi:hypothetical protein KP509_14G044500 [Ceratopteris richardii]|uniref:Guanine nucleotide-binding protein alpha subunit n=1 Tax=Ceratopteris richardii TaxID=49495 RepID=A0A8T2TBE2_CERRI|nr:hypothetical protein KP509_14G044500 [Ceratopteris richardii]KAH7415452.1 hypothetical protein KP509_14G044500 [Ceratopteris richardii]